MLGGDGLASAQPCECLLSSVRSEAVAARAAAVARGCAGVRVSSSGLRAEDEATALGGASAFGGPEPIPRWVVWVLGVLSSPMNKHNASLHSAASGADSTAGDRSFPAYDRQGHRRGTRPGDLLCVCPPGWHRFWSSWTGFRYATHFSAVGATDAARVLGGHLMLQHSVPPSAALLGPEIFPTPIARHRATPARVRRSKSDSPGH